MFIFHTHIHTHANPDEETVTVLSHVHDAEGTGCGVEDLCDTIPDATPASVRQTLSEVCAFWLLLTFLFAYMLYTVNVSVWMARKHGGVSPKSSHWGLFPPVMSNEVVCYLFEDLTTCG